MKNLPTLTPQVFNFLKGLKKNNNKEWLDGHRDAYLSSREIFHAFVHQLLESMQKLDSDLQTVESKKCLFRINRDIRFSKDKRPYKNNFGAFMNKGGKKSATAGYYLHLEPGNSFVAAGIWMPEPEQVATIRQEIDYCLEEFKSILKSAAFKKTYGDMDREAELTRPPKGYPADHPGLDYLRLKSFTVTAALEDKVFLDHRSLKTILKFYSAAVPLVKFINRSLSEA